MWYAALIVLIAVLYAAVFMKETFLMKYGDPRNDEDLISFDPDAKGKQFFGTTPHTCPCDRPEYDAGLCYPRCDEGYRGVGFVCWAETVPRGIGKVMLLKSCKDSGYDGWNDWGLVCQETIKWNSCKWRSIFGCIGGLEGGNVRAKKLSCDGYNGSHPDEVASLCYARCPPGMRHVPSEPYNCWKGGRGLSYVRGAGTIPPLVRVGTCSA